VNYLKLRTGHPLETSEDLRMGIQGNLALLASELFDAENLVPPPISELINAALLIVCPPLQ